MKKEIKVGDRVNALFFPGYNASGVVEKIEEYFVHVKLDNGRHLCTHVSLVSIEEK